FCVFNLPGYLGTLFGDGEDAADARTTWLFLLVTIGAMIAITYVGAGRMKQRGLDIDGKLPAAD
ncbi:MAG: hypothetical protein ACK53T_10340, partial [Planctomycetota bacterium]